MAFLCEPYPPHAYSLLYTLAMCSYNYNICQYTFAEAEAGQRCMYTYTFVCIMNAIVWLSNLQGGDVFIENVLLNICT